MTKPEDLPYTIKERQLIAETAGLRVQILTLEGDEEVPWHHHTEITDTFICLEGPMIVQVKGQDGDHELKPGEIFEVPPYTGHRVASKNGGLAVSWLSRESASTTSSSRATESAGPSMTGSGGRQEQTARRG